MKSLQRTLAVAILAQLLPCAAAHAAPARPDLGTSQAFRGAPVGDDVLALVVGAGGVSFGRVKDVSDVDAFATQQQVGQISRISLDNWWSQTGAALIANNLIAGAVR